MNKTFLIVWHQEDTTEHGVVCAFRKESSAQALIAQLQQISPLVFEIVEVPHYD